MKVREHGSDDLRKWQTELKKEKEEEEGKKRKDDED